MVSIIGLKVEKTSFIIEWLKGHKKPRSKGSSISDSFLPSRLCSLTENQLGLDCMAISS